MERKLEGKPVHNPFASVSVSLVALVVVLFGIAVAMWGCPQYGVYSAKMHGQGELAQAQGNRMALVATANAQDEAAKAFANATSRRVSGWVAAAKQGCHDLGRDGDQRCEEFLISQATLYSIAKEGHEGVNLVIGSGAPPTVAVQPAR